MYTVTLTTNTGDEHTYEDIKEITFTDEHRRARTTYKSNAKTTSSVNRTNLPDYISSVD